MNEALKTQIKRINSIMNMVNSFDQDISADGLICLQKEIRNMPKIINELVAENESKKVDEAIRLYDRDIISKKAFLESFSDNNLSRVGKTYKSLLNERNAKDEIDYEVIKDDGETVWFKGGSHCSIETLNTFYSAN